VAAWAVAGLLAVPALALAEAPSRADRPYLGVAARAEEGGQPGVAVRDVDPDSPAGKAGLKDGDRIVAAGDQAVKSFDDLRKTVASHKPGDKLTLKVMREGKEETVTVTLGKQPAEQVRGAGATETSRPFLGVFTQPLNRAMKDRLGIKADKGAVVASVMPDSPAAKAGLAELDVITRAADTPVNGPEDLRQAVESAGPGKELPLHVIRGDKEMDLKARLGEEPRGVPGGREGFPPMPEGFGRFPGGRLPSVFPGQERMSTLEKKVQDLENRIKELEKSQGKQPPR
jgi:S1-C subfamily serine protease